MIQSAKPKINLILPDGNSRACDHGITGIEFAASISKSLEKAALAVKIDGKLYDLTHPLTKDAKVEIITASSEEGLDILRHDAAHILAEAVKELFPETQVTIGPSIENGFYYDFARATPFVPEDLVKIEAQMKKIIARNEPITRKNMSRSEAIEYFKSLGEHYKVEIISSISESEQIAVYFQGKFADLCRGPHSPTTGKVKAVKLTKLAGAYWRGDSNNEMLQRIYGTAWASEEQLQAYLHQIEEAEKRDHRKLGKEMGLFHFQEEAPGMTFWHPKGWQIFQLLVNYMRRRHEEAGYVEVSTPEVMDKCIWEKSGHWEKFSENMFTAHTSDEGKIYAVKPMNCPGGVQIYNQGIKSYRDLPLRMAEFGRVHRFEHSGALHGLMRARAFTQDDAHIFCTPEQMKDESKKICDLVQIIYKDFGFENVRVKFSDRPEKRIGSDEIWDQAEKALKEAAEYAGLHTTLNPGEGAFYGPKLEFVLKDAIGRDWQLGTLQVDLNLPMRFNAHYTGEDGNKHHPVMLHRALFGSLERFIGIMIEHYAGKLPLWLSPTQVVITSITNEADDYAHELKQALTQAKLRAELDLDNDKINYKIRKHSLAKVPLIVAVGKKEMADRTVSIRRLGSEQQETLALNEFVNRLKNEAMPPF
jgi:threonyl-tRNA synthetase